MPGGSKKKLLVVQVAALSRPLDVPELTFHVARSVFPAVTCTVQASFRTASTPREHGMVGNGRFFRELARPMFWEQSAGLVAGERIWDAFRARGGTVGILFWQQSLGEAADVVLSPAPIHKHHGRMIQDCYCKPPGLYAKLCETLDRPFRLQQYWGPLATAKVGDWIAAATAAVLADATVAPDLCLTYLPTLDYDLQRLGPGHPRSERAHETLRHQLADLLAAAGRHGYDVLVFGDYAIGPVMDAVFPNRALRDAGLMSVRRVKGMLYPDYCTTRAFAVADHEIAHVYVAAPADVEETREVLDGLGGVAEVLDRTGQAAVALDHPNSGELVVVAEEGRWLAYPWWHRKYEAPDYAAHVDIHNKPGYDPCELFFGWPPPSISQNTVRINGSHGRLEPGREVCWAATFDLPGEPGDLIGLAAAVRARLEET